MPPFRNPFGRKPPPLLNLIADPTKAANELQPPTQRSGLSSRTSSALSIPKAKKEPDEFKMSVVNDSGIYLPPSPQERTSTWRRTPTSTTTSSYRSMLSDNEGFSISRESFDSYRRSFDISAKSPVTHEFHPRQSLDSRLSRPSIGTRPERHDPEVVDEETFEEVGLTEEPKPKKRGIFSRFGDSGEHTDDHLRPSSSHRGFHIPGRKRGHSGQGAELGSMPTRQAREMDEVAV